MKNVFAAAVTIVLVVFFTGCSTQATQQNGNFDEELRALQLEYHNIDQAFAAKGDYPLTADGAAAEMRDSDKYFAACKNIFDRQDALFAKYHKQLAAENLAYAAAKLRFGQANHAYWSYLAETNFGHGSNSNRAEYQRIKKAFDEALVAEKQAADALRQAKGE